MKAERPFYVQSAMEQAAADHADLPRPTVENSAAVIEEMRQVHPDRLVVALDRGERGIRIMIIGAEHGWSEVAPPDA